MATASFWMGVENAQQFRELSKQLKQAGRGDLQKRMRREIRQASRPVVRDVQQAVRSVEVTSPKGGHQRPDRSTNLRERVARATGVSTTQHGVRFRVSAAKVGDYGVKLPKYLDASLGNYERWRHPVFGNREVWAQQRGEPYFGVTITRHARDFRRAVQQAMDKVAEEITE